MVKVDKDGVPLWKKAYENKKKFDKKNTVHFGMKFNKNTDADVIEAISKAESKQGFVREAIRFYLAHKEDADD